MFIRKRKVKRVIDQIVENRLDVMKTELFMYINLIKHEMPDDFSEDMGYIEVLERLTKISKTTQLPSNFMKYIRRMKELVAASEELLNTRKTILSALGLRV